MAANSPGDQGLNSINITPMVDVMLVLLVIFMVTTTAIHRLEGMDVDRPDAASGAAVEHPEDGQVHLTCREDGEVWVDGDPVPDDDAVLAAIKARKEAYPDLQGVLSCDEDADVRTLVHLLDLLRLAGVSKYAIATEQPQEQRG